MRSSGESVRATGAETRRGPHMHVRFRTAAMFAALASMSAGGVALTGTGTAGANQFGSGVRQRANVHGQRDTFSDPAAAVPTATPIKHLVVIFDENVSFDHYFGTYPYATNPPGEPSFTAAPGTPTVTGLFNSVSAAGPSGPLLTANPNKLPTGATPGAQNPVRLDPSQSMTCDQNHGYTAEQNAVDGGAMDNFIAGTGGARTLTQGLSGPTLNGAAEPIPPAEAGNYAVMDYFDGNTVTSLWNYAQHFAMSDNAYGTNYGPSTDGAINVPAANTYGAICGPIGATINDLTCPNPPGYNTAAVASSSLSTIGGPTGSTTNLGAGPGTDISDSDPLYDICSYLPSANGGDGHSPAQTIAMGGPHIGTSLNTAGITWGWF